MATLFEIEQDSVLCPVIGKMAGATVIVTAVLERTAICCYAGDKSGKKFVIRKTSVEVDPARLKYRG